MVSDMSSTLACKSEVMYVHSNMLNLIGSRQICHIIIAEK